MPVATGQDSLPNVTLGDCFGKPSESQASIKDLSAYKHAYPAGVSSLSVKSATCLPKVHMVGGCKFHV